MLIGIEVPLSGQSDSSPSYNLDTVVITSGRIVTPYVRLPVSVSSVDFKKTNKFLSHTDLSEALNHIPGLFTLDGQNYAQDLRISLRGFGARSAFGIRGIKLIVDGIPETTPDGQGQLDNISISDITSIEVLQGTSSSQYGNASGGLIQIKTFDDEAYNLKSSIRFGSFGMQEYMVGSSQMIGKTLVQFSGNHQRSNGYREHSQLRQTNLLAKMTHEWRKSKLTWIGSILDSPVAEDPGGINLEQAISEPESARDRNISFDAGEKIKHWKSSLRLEQELASNLTLDVKSFYSKRDFDGRLPFANGGAIDLNRDYGGLMTQVNHNHIASSSVNKMALGFEYLSQRDKRERFINMEGERGDLTLSQLEKFDVFGIYFMNQWSSKNWTATGSVRYDNNAIGVEDEFISNGDDSGNRKLGAINYSAGILFNYKTGHSLFSNYSTSFETPTLSELSSNPNGVGGFNEDLNPMKAKTFEIGSKGIFEDQTSYSLTFFKVKSSDELVPFEIDTEPGRTFFRNAGSTSRFGVEATLSLNVASDLRFFTSYSFSNFIFDEYNVDGNDLSDMALPGIPKHSLTSSIIWQPNGFFAKITTQYFSRIYVKDDNSVSVDKYNIVGIRLGHEIDSKGHTISPFIGINNLGSHSYFDNLRLNAFGGRYYEPAANINWQLGVTLKVK